MSHVAILWQYVVHKINEISSLSNIDYVRLVATYHEAATGKPETESALEARGYSPEALAEAKKKVEAKFSPITSQGLRFTRPLKHFKSDIFGYSMVLLENYERGLLPFPGSVSEQPAQIMEIFGLLQSLRHEREEKRRKLEQDGRHKRQGKSRAGR